MMDVHDVEWKCGCGHTNPDFDEACNGCGEERYDENKAEREGMAAEDRAFREYWEGHETQDDRDRQSLRDAGRGHLV